jgi:hypothetical protein
MKHPEVRVGHSAQLFEEDPATCDACGETLDPVLPSDDDSFELRGEGALLWWRGDSFREEKRPLCPSCAAAIGMTALSRWAIEEEEG